MKCILCDAEFQSNGELKKHLKKQHDLDIKEYYLEHPQAEKYCSKCKQSLPIANFLSDKSNSYGYRAQCIHCMRPGRMLKPCPICNRLLSISAIVNHMDISHKISPEEAYEKYLKEKHCSNCNEVKPLDAFSKLQDPKQVCFSLCRDCNDERNFKRQVGDEEYQVIHHLITRLAFSDQCFTCKMSHDESLVQFKEPLHIDHIIPFAENGFLSLGNALLLCKNCNLSKGTKKIDEFLLSYFKDEALVQQHLEKLANIHKWAHQEYTRVRTKLKYKAMANGKA
jgi:hypothetical protein